MFVHYLLMPFHNAMLSLPHKLEVKVHYAQKAIRKSLILSSLWNTKCHFLPCLPAADWDLSGTHCVTDQKGGWEADFLVQTYNMHSFSCTWNKVYTIGRFFNARLLKNAVCNILITLIWKIWMMTSIEEDLRARWPTWWPDSSGQAGTKCCSLVALLRDKELRAWGRWWWE